MKKKFMTLIGSIVFAFCLIVTGAVVTIHAQAEGEATSGKNLYFSAEPVAYINDGNSLSGDGYLFAGWYNKTGDDYTAVRNPEAGKSYYVKYVPEEMLGVKAQVSKNIISSTGDVTQTTENAIRFLTSLDSTNYKDVGFEIAIGGVVQDTEKNKTNYVYETIYAIGATEATENNRYEYSADQVFGNNASKFFKTYTFTEIPEVGFNTDITARAYYTTYDGVTVYGTQVIRSVNFCRGWFYVSSSAYDTGAANVGTKSNPATLETAVAIPVDEKVVTPRIYVTDNIQIQEKVVLNNSAKVVLQNEANSVTITRGTGTTMFDVAAGCSLTIDGKITVDGNKANSVKGPSMIKNAGTFELGAEATLQNAETGGSSDTAPYQGAALYNTGTAEITGTVTGNGAYKGGAIYTSGNILISGNITNNTSTFQAGAMYVIDGSVTLKSDVRKEVSGNQAGNYGGAIYVYDGILSAENYQFKGNKSSNTDNNSARGGVFYIAQKASVDVEKCIFGAEDSENANAATDGNASAYGGAIYVSGNLTVDKCDFHNNTSKTSGGAVGIHNTAADSVVEITGSTFAKNDAKASSGAIDVNGPSTKIQVQGCTFTGNTNVNDGTISVRTSGKQVNISGLTMNGDVICVYSEKTVGISGSITGATIQLKATTSKVQVNGMLDSNVTIKPSAYTVNTALVTFADGISENDKASIASKLIVDNTEYYIDVSGKLQKK